MKNAVLIGIQSHNEDCNTFSKLKMAILSIAIVALLMFLSSNAHAAAGAGGGLPYEDWLTRVRASITGPVAFAVSIIAIVAAGAMMIFGGDMNGFMKTLVFIVLVLAFVIAAQNMLTAITGTGTVIAQGLLGREINFQFVKI